MLYYNIVKHLNGYPNLLPVNEDVNKYIDDHNDYYKSVYDFEEHHKKQVEQKNSIAGITDVTTNRIVFDFDSKDLELARQDAVETIRRLIQEINIKPSDILCFFSGGKGFHLEFNIDKRITPKQHKQFAINIANDLESFDDKVYNAVRFLRVVNTKHNETGLYKIPLTAQELRDISIEDIKFTAKAPRILNTNTSIVKIPNELFKEEKKEIPLLVKKNVIDWSKKPKWLSNCRFALQNGLFKEGMRSNALSCLAATYKAQGFTEEHTRNFLISVINLQAQENECEPFPEEELENVLNPVYSDSWQGGIYTCKEPGWLHNYCVSLGEHCCTHSANIDVVKMNGISTFFDNFVNDLDSNLIYSGLKQLDKRIKFLVGTSNFIIGSPGVGKTSLILQILKHNSDNNINSLFFSYDMFHSSLFVRLCQGVSGLTQDEIFDIFKNNMPEKYEIKDKLDEHYKNVNFCFKSGQTIEDLERTITETENNIGKKLKLIVVDYNELIIARSSDPTQASAEVAQALRRIANEKQVCIITLLQPSKLYSNPADEVISYNNAKGSGSLGASATVVLGISRPGYNPLDMSQDNYFSIVCLKNRNGGLFSLDFKWSGLKGEINPLEYGDEEILKTIRALREQRRKETNVY